MTRDGPHPCGHWSARNVLQRGDVRARAKKRSTRQCQKQAANVGLDKCALCASKLQKEPHARKYRDFLQRQIPIQIYAGKALVRAYRRLLPASSPHEFLTPIHHQNVPVVWNGKTSRRWRVVQSGRATSACARSGPANRAPPLPSRGGWGRQCRDLSGTGQGAAAVELGGGECRRISDGKSRGTGHAVAVRPARRALHPSLFCPLTAPPHPLYRAHYTESHLPPLLFRPPPPIHCVHRIESPGLPRLSFIAPSSSPFTFGWES